MRTAFKASLALLFALAVTDAWGAVVVYKLTDRQGRVTYVDAVPKGFDGTVTRMSIEPGDHTVRLPDPPAANGARAETEYEQIIRRKPAADPRDAKVAEARTRLLRAQEALQVAQESASPEDWIYMGPGRRAPRPEYEARLNQLDANVRAAEETLRVAERGW